MLWNDLIIFLCFAGASSNFLNSLSAANSNFNRNEWSNLFLVDLIPTFISWVVYWVLYHRYFDKVETILIKLDSQLDRLPNYCVVGNEVFNRGGDILEQTFFEQKDCLTKKRSKNI